MRLLLIVLALAITTTTGCRSTTSAYRPTCPTCPPGTTPVAVPMPPPPPPGFIR